MEKEKDVMEAISAGLARAGYDTEVLIINNEVEENLKKEKKGE